MRLHRRSREASTRRPTVVTPKGVGCVYACQRAAAVTSIVRTRLSTIQHSQQRDGRHHGQDPGYCCGQWWPEL
ncbi:hypothetical protein PG987_001819 [Apiospora arundinis]